MFVMMWKSGPSLERGLLDLAWWRSWLELYGTIVKLRFRSNWPRLKVSLSIHNNTCMPWDEDYCSDSGSDYCNTTY